MTLQKLWDGLHAAVTTHSTITVVLIYLLLNVIEISPVKVQPLSWIFKGLKKALVGTLEARVTAMEYKNDLEFAKIARARIQRFADELYYRTDLSHSRQHFEQIFDDINAYDAYCESHPQFANHKTIEATNIIKSTYHKCLEDHSFL